MDSFLTSCGKFTTPCRPIGASPLSLSGDSSSSLDSLSSLSDDGDSTTVGEHESPPQSHQLGDSPYRTEVEEVEERDEEEEEELVQQVPSGSHGRGEAMSYQSSSVNSRNGHGRQSAALVEEEGNDGSSEDVRLATSGRSLSSADRSVYLTIRQKKRSWAYEQIQLTDKQKFKMV